MSKIELCDVGKCTQCLACVNICPKSCISMADVEAGFRIPDIDRDKCIECGACMKACHVITPTAVPHSPLKTYAAWTRDNRDRSNSSSGGAFSVLARKVLSMGGTVYGATMTEDLKVKHIGIRRQEDLILLQGSKYVQSYMGDTFKEVRGRLLKNETVLFSGTPCQIAGLKAFLKKDYEKLYTCDVVCHGVPSQEAFDVYIDKIGIRSKTHGFSFRFTEGWGFRKEGHRTCESLLYPGVQQGADVQRGMLQLPVCPSGASQRHHAG